MRKTIITLLFLPLLMSISCSQSPDAKGEKIAEAINKCAENYLENRQKAESQFVTDFDPSSYKTRSAAIDAYNNVMADVYSNYEKELEKIYEKDAENLNEYSSNYQMTSVYQNARDEGLNTELQEKVTQLSLNNELPTSVKLKIKSVAPYKPDAEIMQKDLVGHEIAEGLDEEESWIGKDWRWKIKEGQIKDFKIEEVETDNSTDYAVVASMRLQSEYTGFDTKLKIAYHLPEYEDWEIEYVNSLGMHLVKTHKYDNNCLSYEIKDDGWGGVKALYITNLTEIELAVGGYIYTHSKKVKFSQKIGPQGKIQVGGTFGGGNVSSYEIEFIERPYNNITE